MTPVDQVFGPMPPVNDVLPNNAPNGFLYDLVYIPGGKQMNSLRNRAENEAALAQSQQEHNDALNSFGNMLNLPIPVREQLGKQAERELAKWNPAEDTNPRRRLSPSSSVISELKITPQNTIAVKYGTNPKEYEYRGGNTIQEAARNVLELINSPSIEEALNKRIPGSWGSRNRI